MKKSKKFAGIKPSYVVISVIAVLAVCSVAFAYSLTQNVNVSGNYNYYEAEQPALPSEVNLGAFPGGDIYNPVHIHEQFSFGGSYYVASSSTGNKTLTRSEMDGYLLDLEQGTPSMQYTLPATSTLIDLIGREVGATREWLIHSATTTASQTLTIIASTGVDLVGSETDANQDVIDTQDYATLKCTRIPYDSDDTDNVDVVCLMTEYGNAD